MPASQSQIDRSNPISCRDAIPCHAAPTNAPTGVNQSLAAAPILIARAPLASRRGKSDPDFTPFVTDNAVAHLCV